ncbi:MAG: protein kinase [Bryobacteraceae bacterium]
MELPESDRARFLAEQCGADEDLRREVERLLVYSPERSAFIDRPAVKEGLLRQVSEGALQPGEVLAERFRVVRQVGAGGMGAVYQAEDLKLGGSVALKTIRPEIASDPRIIARFQRELQLSRQVTHPNVCRVHDIFSAQRANGGAVDFLTMEFIDGETLSAYLDRQAPLSLEDALPIIEQICFALDAAHGAGVLHRDLKGSNILVGKLPGGSLRAVVTDFGLARTIDGSDATASRSGWGAGTPAYMAPEQLEGSRLSAATDIYALGIVMYEMATGKQPWSGDSPLQVAVKRIKEQPPKPSDSNGNMDRRWETAILRCLAYDPARRPASGAEVLEALRGRRTLTIPNFRLPKARSRWAFATAAMVTLAAGSWWFRDDLFPHRVSPEVARWYGEGVTAAADGTYHKAAQLLEKAVQADSMFAAAHCRLAEAYQELDYRDRARDELVKALDARPGARADRLLCDATKWQLVGEWDKSLGALRTRATRADSAEKGRALLDVARVLERAGRGDQAVGAYEEVLRHDSSQPGARVRLAALLADRNQIERSTKLLDEAEGLYRTLGNAEGQGEVLLTRTVAESKLPVVEELAAKAEQFGEQAASESVRIRAKLRRAQALEAQGKPDESRRVTEEAVKLATSAGMGSVAANGLIDLGQALFTHRKYEEAESYYDDALRMAKRYGNKMTEARASMFLGDLYGRTKRPEKALAILDASRKFFESAGERGFWARTLRVEGDIYRLRTDYPKAANVYEEAFRRSESEADRVTAKERLASLALVQERYRDAATRYAEAVEIRSAMGNKALEQVDRIRRSQALRRLGAFEESQAELARVLLAPANDGIRQTVEFEQASLDFQMGKADASLERLEQLRASAEQGGQKALLGDIKLSLCAKYGEAQRAAQALLLCREMVSSLSSQPARLIDALGALAQAEALTGRLADAVEHARRAVKIAQAEKLERDGFSWMLVLTEILHQARDPGWKNSRDQAAQLRAGLERKMSAADFAADLNRPVLAARWRRVQSLQ